MATCNFCGGPAKEIQRCPRCDTSDAAPPVLTEEEQRCLLAGAAALDLYRDESAGDMLRDLHDRLTTGG